MSLKRKDCMEITDIYQSNKLIVENVALRYANKNVELAKDYAGQTWYNVVVNFEKFNSSEGYDGRAWVLKILHNIVINNVRKNSNHHFCDVDVEIFPDFRNLMNQLRYKRLSKKALEICEKMSPKYGKVAYLAFFEELSYSEIADKLDILEGTVKSRLHRARKILIEKLKDLYE